MKRIAVNEYGIRSGEDVTEALYALFEANKTDTEFVFEKGEYYFSPKFEYPYSLSNSNRLDIRRLGIWMREMKNVRVDFGGSKLLFGGHMNAVSCDRCENITLENAVIDWPEPLVAEGIVVGVGEDTIDLYIDQKRFPHVVNEHGMMFYFGNGEANYLWAGRQFDAASRTTTRYSEGRLDYFPTVTPLGGDVYRFHQKGYRTTLGNILVLRHNLRLHAGVFAEKCRDFTLENITFHATSGIGVLSQFCENVTCHRVFFAPNKEAGRIICGGRDDGIHVTSCKGTVSVSECTFFGLMDDPINIHGCSVIVEEALDDRTVRCRYGHDEAKGFLYWGEEGDEIAFLDRRHMNPIAKGTVEKFSPEDIDHFTLTLSEPLAADVRGLLSSPTAVAAENLTKTPAVVCRNNRFGSCQGRGMLVSTPKSVKILDNYFTSSGSAILIPGDANEWFESGACHDVEIAGNVFTDTCRGVKYQFCEGVISICPVVPEADAKLPFHSNINIHNNTFDTPDVPVLYAYSAEKLQFTDNTLFFSPTADCTEPEKALFILDSCRDAEIVGNRTVGQFTLKKSDVKNCENILCE